MPSANFDLGTVTEQTYLKARVISGKDIYDETGKTKVTDEVATVKKLLGPLAQSDVDILRCVGLNYSKHSNNPQSTAVSDAFFTQMIRRRADYMTDSR